MVQIVMPQDIVNVCLDIVVIDANVHANMELMEQIVKISANVKTVQLVIQFLDIVIVAPDGEDGNAIDHV
jgi:predicted transcriptional regulator